MMVGRIQELLVEIHSRIMTYSLFIGLLISVKDFLLEASTI